MHCHDKDFKTCQSTGNPDPGFVDQYSLSPKRLRGTRNDTFRHVSTDLDATLHLAVWSTRPPLFQPSRRFVLTRIAVPFTSVQMFELDK
uniref:Uncharacterized protein n=1 Tax=Moniliophthora roreri TaxID=221103 RepID=A0A0W0GBN1_MONRR